MKRDVGGDVGKSCRCMTGRGGSLHVNCMTSNEAKALINLYTDSPFSSSVEGSGVVLFS